MKLTTCLVILAALTAPAVNAGTGDVDNDGRVTLRDATMAAQIAAVPGSGTTLQRSRADVLPLTSEAGDGQVTMSDVRYILRVAAGLAEHPTWITVPVFIYRVCDDDGSRCCAITPQQMQQWVDYASTAYLPARVRLSFNQADFVDLKSTLLNGMTGVSHPQWASQKALANSLAAQHYGYVTVFARYGPDAGPTGGGFSWWDYNFAVMPGFNVTVVCGHQNLGLFGHELGHYFGLPHTFAATFSTVAQAEQYLTQHNNDINTFDGDGLSDTPPDPYNDAHQCDTTESVVLNGTSYPIARHNIMSYWESPVRTLSYQQSQRLRWMVRTRMRNGMAMPTNAGLTSPIEGETATVNGSYKCSYGVQDMSPWGAAQWSGGKQLFCGAQADGWVSLTVNVAASRVYQVSAYYTQAPDFGIVQAFLDGQPLGDAFDAYAFFVTPSGRIPLGSAFLLAGNHELRFQAISMNPLSTNTFFGLDCLTLITRAL